MATFNAVGSAPILFATYGPVTKIFASGGWVYPNLSGTIVTPPATHYPALIDLLSASSASSAVQRNRKAGR